MCKAIQGRAFAIISLILAILILAQTVITFIPRQELYSGENPLMKDGELPVLVAHRGGGGEFPQNTLEAFYNAYSVDENVIFETDVSITKDGVLILLHNLMLDATTNVTGLASDWNYSDLIEQRVNFGYDNPTKSGALDGDLAYFEADGVRKLPTDVTYPEGVEARDEEIYLATTLEDILLAFPESRISVEIKQSGELGLKAVEEAIRLLEKYDAFDRVILASYHSEVFDEFKRLQSGDLVPDSFMYSPGIAGIAKYYVMMALGLDTLYSDGIAVLQLPTKEYGINFATKRMLDTAHEHNIAVHYWTVNSADEMRMLIELGVDGIMTDNPSLLKSVLEEYKK